MITPSRTEFAALAPGHTAVPVARSFLFDSETAVTAYAKLRRPPFGFLLESLVGGEKWARYTFIGTAARGAWRLHRDGRVSAWSPSTGWSAPQPADDPLADLEWKLQSVRVAAVPGMPRFIGGAVGYLGYDVVRCIEDLADAPPASLDVPDALLLFTDTILAIDNIFGRAQAITLVDVANADDVELDRRYDAAVARLDELVQTLGERTAPAPLPLPASNTGIAFDSSCTRDEFEHAVDRVKEYIRAGDAFQVVLSQRLSVPTTRDPFDMYRALRSLNPSPYLYFVELDGVALVGSSPEVLVRVDDGAVTVRPIAGTRPRGRTDEEDALRESELRADGKELAEHLMLVDLGRNDVGRVSRFGSVRVTSFMNVEKYSHVLHLVSQVEGILRDDLSAMDVFRACFPAGTVSGAPKIRAMQIIDELEPVRRGVYAGAVGYIAYGARTMDTAIAIRTIVARDGIAYVQAGAGIVADSDPAREYDETLAKARALLTVLQPPTVNSVSVSTDRPSTVIETTIL